MKRLSKTLLPFLFLGLIFTQCKEDEPEVQQGEINFTTTVDVVAGQTAASIGDTLVLATGYDFNLKKFKLYLSNITLIDSEGGEHMIEDIMLADVGDPVTGQFKASVEAKTFTAIRYGYGLDSIQNDEDPEDFPREHPLSSFNQMYWSMLKYRFAILEGRSNVHDSLGNPSDMLHAYHPGTDPLYRVVTHPLNFQLAGGDSQTIDLLIHFEELFTHGDGIDLRTEPQTHSEPVDIHIARKFMDNLAATAEIRLLN